MRHRARWTLSCAVALATPYVVAGAAFAVDFQVDSTLDQIDDDVLDGLCHTAGDVCTLRAAIMQANWISAPGVTIRLPAGTYLLTRPAIGADGDDNGDLNFRGVPANNPLIELIGAGAESTVIDANQLDRVMRIDAGRRVSLSSLTLRNGKPTVFDGSGLLASGFTTLTRVTIRDNAAIFGGGLRYLADPGGGSLRLVECTIRDNFAGQAGGLQVAGQVTIERSAIHDNAAQIVGGILTDSADLRLVESTVSSNRASGLGGGLFVGHGSVVNVYNSTIAFNQADSDLDGDGVGGGLFVEAPGTLNLRNALVAGNYVSDGQQSDDCAGTLSSYGRNLFGGTAGCTVVTGSGSWDLFNDLATLGPLAKNGGPTATHALLPGSNAIEGGDPVDGCLGPTAPLAVDQRGAPRISGALCDVGAYEEGVLFLDAFESGDLSAWPP